MNKFPLNIINIGPLLQKAIDYSRIIKNQCVGVLHDMKYLIKEFALSLLKYIHVFLIVGISLLGLTLLLSKNKLGNLLVLFYLYLILLIFGFVVGILAMIVFAFEKTIELVKQLFKLVNMERKISIRCVIDITIVILTIFLFAIELAIVLAVLSFFALVIDFFFGILIQVFKLINDLYSSTSLVAQTATGALETFGHMVRKGFQNCR